MRATRLRSARQRVGMTQRELARRVDVTQNYIPALEANTRQAGPGLRGPLLEALGADFWDVFDVVLISPDGTETRLVPEAATGSYRRR